MRLEAVAATASDGEEKNLTLLIQKLNFNKSQVLKVLSLVLLQQLVRCQELFAREETREMS